MMQLDRMNEKLLQAPTNAKFVLEGKDEVILLGIFTVMIWILF